MLDPFKPSKNYMLQIFHILYHMVQGPISSGNKILLFRIDYQMHVLYKCIIF